MNNIAGQTNSADVSNLEDLQIELPLLSYLRTISRDESEDVWVTKDVSFDQAKQVEIKSWRDNNVFKEVQDEGQKNISTRWVYTLKETLAGLRPKSKISG